MRARRHGGTTGHAESRATGSASPLMPCDARGFSVFLGVQVVRRRSESRSGTPMGNAVVGSPASGQVAAVGASSRPPPAVDGPRIGAPYSALGQATVHWGRLLACPSRWFPAPMLPLFIESLAEALLKGAITLKDTNNGARRPRRRARSRAHTDPENTRNPPTQYAPEAGRTQTRRTLGTHRLGTRQKPGAHRPGEH